MSLFDKRAVAAAVRTEEDFSAALKSEVDVIFLLYSSIMTVEAQIDRAHKAGKKALIHMDFAEGIGKDRAGLHFIKLKGADGILTTKTNMIRPAKDIGLVTVQRFFIVDSHSIDTAVDTIRTSRPDMIEIMPGVLCKIIQKFHKNVQMPVIAGGLVETKKEVMEALDAGASAVSTGCKTLWYA